MNLLYTKYELSKLLNLRAQSPNVEMGNKCKKVVSYLRAQSPSIEMGNKCKKGGILFACAALLL